MRLLIVLSLLAAAALAGNAQAGDFQLGIVNPTRVAPADSAALGSTMQRYQLVWNGQPSFDGSLILAPGTRPVLTVALYRSWAGALPTTQAGRNLFAGWLRSVLERFPQIKDVVVGNEIAGASWPYYPALLQTVAPLIRAFGARVIGPGAYPFLRIDSQQRLLDAIAAAGPHLLDTWDMHGYRGNVAEVVQQVRRTLRWRIPVWVSEDGVQSRPPVQFANLYFGTADSGWNGSEDEQAARLALRMRIAYCAGASAWFNFLLRDEPNLIHWQSGLERPDGSHKPAFAAFAATSRAIAEGRVNCALSPSAPSASRTSPPSRPSPRRAGRSQRAESTAPRRARRRAPRRQVLWRLSGMLCREAPRLSLKKAQSEARPRRSPKTQDGNHHSSRRFRRLVVGVKRC
jgi:hypothetical protein